MESVDYKCIYEDIYDHLLVKVDTKWNDGNVRYEFVKYKYKCLYNALNLCLRMRYNVWKCYWGYESVNIDAWNLWLLEIMAASDSLLNVILNDELGICIWLIEVVIDCMKYILRMELMWYVYFWDVSN